MNSVPPLLSFLLMIVSGWVHRRQLIVIGCLKAEKQMLKDRLRGKRIRFPDAERALLARKAKAVGRKALLELDTIISPDTLMRWHRQFAAPKWNFNHRRRPGRPGVMREISELIVRICLKRIRGGDTRAYRVLWRMSGTGSGGHCGQCPSQQRHRAGPGARQALAVVDVPQGALEALGSQRLFQR